MGISTFSLWTEDIMATTDHPSNIQTNLIIWNGGQKTRGVCLRLRYDAQRCQEACRQISHNQSPFFTQNCCLTCQSHYESYMRAAESLWQTGSVSKEPRRVLRSHMSQQSFTFYFLTTFAIFLQSAIEVFPIKTFHSVARNKLRHNKQRVCISHQQAAAANTKIKEFAQQHHCYLCSNTSGQVAANARVGWQWSDTQLDSQLFFASDQCRNNLLFSIQDIAGLWISFLKSFHNSGELLTKKRSATLILSGP